MVNSPTNHDTKEDDHLQELLEEPCPLSAEKECDMSLPDQISEQTLQPQEIETEIIQILEIGEEQLIDSLHLIDSEKQSSTNEENSENQNQDLMTVELQIELEMIKFHPVLHLEESTNRQVVLSAEKEQEANVQKSTQVEVRDTVLCCEDKVENGIQVLHVEEYEKQQEKKQNEVQFHEGITFPTETEYPVPNQECLLPHEQSQQPEEYLNPYFKKQISIPIDKKRKRTKRKDL
jgi:hypothetical protein